MKNSTPQIKLVNLPVKADPKAFGLGATGLKYNKV